MTDVNPMASLLRFFAAENEFASASPDQRDISTMLRELDPDVVVEVPDSLPHGGTWRGHAGFEELFGVVSREWQDYRVVGDASCLHVLDDDRILVEGVLHGVVAATGRRVAQPIISLFTFTPRGAVHLVHYYKDTAAVVLGDNTADSRS